MTNSKTPYVVGRWRLALNHRWLDDDSGLPTFHAYDERDRALCTPIWGLAGTHEPPNEGSHFCATCLDLTTDSGPSVTSP